MIKTILSLHFLLTFVYFLIYLFLGFKITTTLLIVSSIFSLFLYIFLNKKNQIIIYNYLYNITFFTLMCFSGGINSFESWFLMLNIIISYLLLGFKSKHFYIILGLVFVQHIYSYLNPIPNELGIYYENISYISQITFFINLLILFYLDRKQNNGCNL